MRHLRCEHKTLPRTFPRRTNYSPRSKCCFFLFFIQGNPAFKHSRLCDYSLADWQMLVRAADDVQVPCQGLTWAARSLSEANARGAQGSDEDFNRGGLVGTKADPLAEDDAAAAVLLRSSSSRFNCWRLTSRMSVFCRRGGAGSDEEVRNSSCELLRLNSVRLTGLSSSDWRPLRQLSREPNLDASAWPAPFACRASAESDSLRRCCFGGEPELDVLVVVVLVVVSSPGTPFQLGKNWAKSQSFSI